MPKKPTIPDASTELRRRAEAQLHGRGSKGAGRKSAFETVRVLHELEVHQIELELQNAELQEARNRTEALLEKYTDLYDFAPVGYLSLDEQGSILEINLTGAGLLDTDRSHLLNRRIVSFLLPASQPLFLAFLKRIFIETGKQVCEAALLRKDATALWCSFHGTAALSTGGPRKWCRVTVSDITSLKQAEEAQRRMEVLTIAIQSLKSEIVRRQAVEKALKKSKKHQADLLQQSHRMQEQLRHLSREVLRAQEEERKRVSRELHDVIGQALTSINLRLSALKKDAVLDPKSIEKNVVHTQQMVEHSVNIVHRFARELRPTVLDDLGLIPALHTFMKGFTKETGIRVNFSAFAGVAQVNGDKRTVLYRVAQEALNNAARHAKASRIDVKIQKVGSAVCMTIKDNGEGFRQGGIGAKNSKRLGLLGMRERLDMIGGCFDITSRPGKGTTVTARIPLTGQPLPGPTDRPR